MIFEKINNNRLQTSSEIALFDKGSGVTEYMVIVHITDTSLSYETQLHHLLMSFDELHSQRFSKANSVFKRFFLSDAANQANLLEVELIDNSHCAVSIVEQPPLDGSKIALWAYLQTGVSTKALPNGMYAVQNGAYTHLWTGTTLHEAAHSEYQMRLLFNDYALQLAQQGCTLAANAIRTWIFVQNIDVNYAGVVKARNEIFATQGLTSETHFIASTGIQGRNANSKNIVQLNTYAVKGLKAEQIQYLYAKTHLNPTYEYGVSFERGTCIHYEDRRHVFISGTASIDNKGQVLYVGDIKKQAERMIENVGMLLAEAECDFSNVMQILVYLRDIADYQIVSKLFEERFPTIPKVILLAAVCRSTWLIEMECIAIK